MEIITGLALAGAAGLNAPLPLIVLAMAERLGRRVGLVAPFEWLASGGGILALLFVLPVEIFADKIPRADVWNDRLGFAYRPLAGAVAMAAVTHGTALSLPVAALIGGGAALAVHLLKIFYRRPLAGFQAGTVQPFASFWEDTLVAAIGVFAFIVPVVGVVMLALTAALMGWIGAILRRRTARAALRP